MRPKASFTSYVAANAVVLVAVSPLLFGCAPGTRHPCLPAGRRAAPRRHPDKRTTQVIAGDVRTGTEKAHVDLDAPYAECCGGGQEIEIHGIDLEDVVYWNDRSGKVSWAPGQQPRRLDRGNDPFTDPRRHYVLRCDVTDGSCERTLPPGPAESWVFPER